MFVSAGVHCRLLLKQNFNVDLDTFTHFYKFPHFYTEAYTSKSHCHLFNPDLTSFSSSSFYTYLTNLILPDKPSVLCKSGLCVVLHLRAYYRLVSLSEDHPDEHYTWLPFPPAHCNPLKNRPRDSSVCEETKKSTFLAALKCG